MSKDDCFIEIAHKSIHKAGQEVCGDVFLSRKIFEEGRTVSVLSDGLGSGIKANILATLTSSMALNFTIDHQPLLRSSKAIKSTLPIDQDRKIGYSTFSIVDIEYDMETTIIEYGNPHFLVFRGAVPNKESGKEDNISDIIRRRFMAQIEDRIIFFTDGVSQSGIGRTDMPFGWDINDIELFIQGIVGSNSGISAEELVKQIIERAYQNDSFSAKDDISCAVIYFRKPRNLLICSGPPYKKENDKLMTDIVRTYNGNKIICGGTTAQIIGRELGLEINTDMSSGNNEIPPFSVMEGIDLVTEGILTIGKVAQYLETGENVSGRNSACRLIKFILKNDHIKFIIGTKINEAHQDPTLPVELDIRRNVIKKIAQILKDKYLKEVEIHYI